MAEGISRSHRRVADRVVYFGPPQHQIGITCHHPAEDTIHAEVQAGLIALIMDECADRTTLAS